MPNRILKESICSSENIDQLSPVAEIAFYRLIVNCDDYGRMDGRVRIIKSRLFPLKDFTEDEMLMILGELEQAELIQTYVVDGKPYLQMRTWENHQQVRNHKSKYPSPNDGNCNQLQSNDINCNQMQSNDINCNQMQSNDSKCPRNPIQSESLSESLSLSESNALIADDEAHEIQHEHDQVIEAAKSAGFKCTDSEIAGLLRLYADNGLDKMLSGFTACVDHSAPNLAYLRAVLSGKPKEKPNGKVIPAQNFPQRDYKSVNDELMDSTAKEVAEFLAQEVV